MPMGGGTAVQAPPNSISGRYHLDSVDGSPLPGTIEHSADISTEITGGHLDVTEVGGFSLQLRLRFFTPEADQLALDTTVGDWRRQESRITLMDSLGHTRIGVIDGIRITISGERTFVFVRD